jgi:LuxR family maltose regulon positive regulatory protein
MHAALGDERKSLIEAAKALELAEPEGFISIFVEEGEPVKKILIALRKSDLLGKVRPGYVQEILAAFPPNLTSKEELSEGPVVNSLVEPLTSRELEVLRLIAEGDSNQAIAKKLVITVSAVKKHTGNIYGKLNINSRTQAVARARQLGLLSQDE